MVLKSKRLARRVSTGYEYVTYPDKRLTMKCLPVSDINSSTTLDAVKAITDKYREKPCLGIAAPQIGIGKRIIGLYRPRWISVLDRKENFNRPCLTPEESRLDPLIMINPSIEPLSKSAEFFTLEGCLSFPNEQYICKRFESVKVSYFTLDGKFHIQDWDGPPAVVLQHECDHLDGITMVDRSYNFELNEKNPDDFYDNVGRNWIYKLNQFYWLRESSRTELSDIEPELK